MNVIEVMRLPLAVDLSGFVALLQRLQVPHRVSEEGEEQVLWVPPAISEDVRELYRYPDGNADQQPIPEPAAARLRRPENRPWPARSPPRLLLSCVAGLTGLGDNLTTIAG
jgi:GlpG protein